MLACKASGMRKVALLAAGLVLACAACAPAVRTSSIGTGRFVSDDAIAAVKVCETRGDDVLASFGEPTSRGRDDDFTTYQWIEVASASAGRRAVVGSQVIGVWVDRSGRVARIVVNPTSMPEKPAACDAAPTAKAAPKPDRGASKAKSH